MEGQSDNWLASSPSGWRIWHGVTTMAIKHN